jgi:hypothetical protein
MGLSVYPPILARQQLGKHVLAGTNTRNSRTAGRVIFCAVRDESKSLVGLYMYPPITASNGSVNTFPRQRRIVGGDVLYAVHVLSKESRRFVHTRTSCLYCFSS